MRHLLALSATFLFGGLQAQITIGPLDMPSAGDTVRYRNTTAQGIDPVPTEAGMIWDMGFLVPGIEGADTAVTVGSTPFLYQFFFNNGILYPEHQASFAVRGQSFSFQGLTVTNVFDYFKKGPTGYRNVGFGANVNGVPTSVRRIPVDYIHRFPMTYGDQDTSYSEFTLNVPTLFSFTQKQWRFNEVDGWGTLYLPADTFEVLRVKSVLQRNDSIFISQFNQGFSFPEPETIEYKWIAQGMDEPVLIVTTVGGQVTTARFYYNPADISAQLQETPSINALQVYPNPASDAVFVRVPSGSKGVISVMDAEGRVVLSGIPAINGTTQRVSLDGLVAGVYNVSLIADEQVWSSRIVVK